MYESGAMISNSIWSSIARAPPMRARSIAARRSSGESTGPVRVATPSRTSTAIGMPASSSSVAMRCAMSLSLGIVMLPSIPGRSCGRLRTFGADRTT